MRVAIKNVEAKMLKVMLSYLCRYARAVMKSIDDKMLNFVLEYVCRYTYTMTKNTVRKAFVG